jgi:hypothetical protein
MEIRFHGVRLQPPVVGGTDTTPIGGSEGRSLGVSIWVASYYSS